MTIGNRVTEIGYLAFKFCDGLITVISKIENPFYFSDANFDNSVYNNATLWVPVGSIDKYKEISSWKKFKNIKEGEPTGIQSITIDNLKNIPIYDLNGRKLESPQKGINIIDGKKVVVK